MICILESIDYDVGGGILATSRQPDEGALKAWASGWLAAYEGRDTMFCVTTIDEDTLEWEHVDVPDLRPRRQPERVGGFTVTSQLRPGVAPHEPRILDGRPESGGYVCAPPNMRGAALRTGVEQRLDVWLDPDCPPGSIYITPHWHASFGKS